VAFGFGLTTAALLATPVLNLFFRPIVLVGAVHVLGQIERGEAGEPAVNQVRAMRVGAGGAAATPPLD
jgi:hypothetical protein